MLSALQKRQGLLTMAVAMSVAMSASSCKNPWTTQTTPEAGQPSSVVFFLIDAVRADHVSAYGYHRETTPRFDAFARQNIFFTNAYAPSPWTRPSVASIFTGDYPQRHDVQKRQDVLPYHYDTLAEQLKELGLNTYMINTNPHITETFQMTQGFDEIVEVMPNPDKMKDGNRSDVVAGKLDELIPRLKQPYFLYIHVIDPHYPYDPPRQDLEAIGITAARPSSQARYAGELHFVDRHVLGMVETLDGKGLLDDAIVVITSDHGDEFNDHDSIGHGKTLYQEVVKVPLAMRLPPRVRRTLAGDAAGGDAPTSGADVPYPVQRVDANMTLVDLLPTLLWLTGAKVPYGIDGKNLVSLLWTAPVNGDDLRPLFFSVDKERASHSGILVDQSKLIINRSTGRTSLYLLDKDPREKVPNPSSVEGVAEMRDSLEQMLRSFETSIEPGIHLELACKYDEPNRQRLEVKLTTEGTFVDVKSRMFEDHDKIEIAPDNKSIRLDTWQIARLHRSPMNMHVEDRDELSFDVEPADARFTITVKRNRSRTGLNILRTPRMRKGGWPLSFTRESLQRLTADSLVDRRKEGVYLYARKAQQRSQAAVLSSDLTDALKSLGYLQ